MATYYVHTAHGTMSASGQARLCCTVATTSHLLAYQCDGHSVLTTECHKLVAHLGDLDVSWQAVPRKVEGAVAGALGCDPDLLLATRTYGGWRITWACEDLVSHRRRQAGPKPRPLNLWDWWYSRPEAGDDWVVCDAR